MPDEGASPSCDPEAEDPMLPSRRYGADLGWWPNAVISALKDELAEECAVALKGARSGRPEGSCTSAAALFGGTPCGPDANSAEKTGRRFRALLLSSGSRSRDTVDAEGGDPCAGIRLPINETSGPDGNPPVRTGGTVRALLPLSSSGPFGAVDEDEGDPLLGAKTLWRI